VTGQHLYDERESKTNVRFRLTDKSGREYQVDDGFTGGHDGSIKTKSRRIPTKFEKKDKNSRTSLGIGFDSPNAQQTNEQNKTKKMFSKESERRGGCAEHCCSAGARESSYPATDGEPTETAR